MIRYRDVSFAYANGVEILKNINLHINPGECILLCGKSGCGKTTLTKLINGLIPHFYEGCQMKGDVIVNSMNVALTEIYELAETVGSVFQNPKSQFFNLDSDAELAFGLENAGRSPEYMKQRLAYTIKSLQIKKLLHRNIFSMSGGEKQNLAFASVHAMNPDVYVLDEPTANLDKEAIAVLRQQIINTKAEGKTIVIAEHRLFFLVDLIDRAVYMRDGEIAQILNQDEFSSLPVSERIEMGLRTRGHSKRKKTSSKTGNSTTELVINNLSCSVKKDVVFEKLSFSTSEGEVLGIIGCNGSGKSTLLRCLAGLEKQSNGDILLNGRVLSNKARKGHCYMIMQDVNHQLFSESVWNECELSNGKQSESEVEKVLTDFNLLEWRENHPMALSGGQKQRLAIVTGVLCSKRIILFDEPTSGLDYGHMLIVSYILKKLAEKGHIIIVATHDNEMLECTCDKVITLL